MSDDKEIDEILKEIKNKENGDDAVLSFSEEADVPPEKEEKPLGEFELVAEEDDLNRSEPDMGGDVLFGADENTDSEAPADKKKIAIIVAAVIAIIAIAAAVFAVVKMNNKEPETTAPPTTTTTTTTAAPVIYNNPLTNEPDYNQEAADRRSVAIVVENAYAARPQWGMDDEKNAPDIIVEGEVEGGESRMLWLYADYTKLPDQIGPVRSARPPFIKFSELFDSIFVHWGQSASKGNYIGADKVFSQDKVDHINQMNFSDQVGLFGRDKSRAVASEHTGVLYGAKLADAIAQEGFRTTADKSKFTTFGFNSDDKAVGEAACNSIGVTFSSSSQSRSWVYNPEDKLYYSSDYKNNVARKNILILYDNTEYVVKENYKNGKSETYCDYALSGGKGKLASLGTSADITWSVENGVIVLKDAQGKDINLNTGKTWIGWVSANHGGSDYSG